MERLMKCILLATKGEKLEGAEELHRLGYEIELYPTTKNESELLDSRVDEFIPFINRHPATAERSHVRSLRASFIRMLEDSRYNADLLIFGESDACPLVDAKVLKPIIEKELREHPDTDIFRLFHHAVSTPSGDPDDSGEISFEPYLTNHIDANTPYVWGTHAMIIPASQREKVAKIFKHYRLPTDIALEAANSNGDLKIRVASHNLFYQRNRTAGGKNKKIAVCLTSYKRLIDLQRQIWCMMDQDYADIHVFAAIKGISEYTFKQFLEPQFKHFVEQGRLTMRLFPNKNQLSNFIDATRGLDVSEYELFAKVDDDDLYSRGYFSSVNEFHRYLPDDFSSYYCGTGHYIGKRGGVPFAEKGWFSCFGPTLILGESCMAKIVLCEKEPHRIGKICPRAGHHGYGFYEDSLMHMVMLETGSMNRASYIQLEHPGVHVAIQTANSSVMRGGLLKEDFWNKNYGISNEVSNEEFFLEIAHSHWHDLLRILGDRAKRYGIDDKARVLFFNQDALILKWDNWGTETFVKSKEGVFHLKK